MPRKNPSRGYYDEEEIYEVDHGRPRARHRSKRDRMIEDDEFYPRRRASLPPPVEELDRMQIRDRHGPSSPEYVRESYTKGKGKAAPAPPGLKFRRGRGEVKRSTSIPPPPPSPPSEAERDDFRPPSRAKKPPRGRNGKKVEPEEYVTKDRHGGGGGGGGRRSKAKQIAALMSDSEDDISVKRSSRAAAAAAAAPPPPPPLPAASPEDDDDDESEAEFMRRERRRRKGKMIEPNYTSPVPVPPQFPHKPNTGRHRGKEREDGVPRRAASRSRARSLSARRVSSESDESEADTTETESSTEDSEDDEEEDDDEDDELVILKDEWGRGHRRSRSMSRPVIKSRRDDSSPGSPSLREPSLAARHARRPKYIEQGNCFDLLLVYVMRKG